MKHIKKLFLSCLIFFTNLTFTKIRIVCTAALINDGFELRKKEYVEALEILKNYGYPDCYIVEAVLKRGPSFLDEYSKNVFYSSLNNAALNNKGVNEGKTLLEGLKHFNFDPEDMIIKITGRYHLMSHDFLKLVELNQDADAIAKKDGQYYGILTGCFAIKYRHFIDMLEHIDYQMLERDHIAIETQVHKYLEKIQKEKKAHIIFVDKLNLRAHVWGDAGFKPGTVYW